MQINKINYALIVYLALIEGLSLLVLDFGKSYPFDSVIGLFVGFIPAIVVLSLYRLFSNNLPIKVNGREITKLPFLYLSLANAVFIEVLFLIQKLLPNPSNTLGYALYGFISVLVSSFILILVYNKIGLKVKFMLDMKELKLKSINVNAALYAGLFEFFILPLMALFYYLKINVFLNGFVSGLVGSLISVWIVNKILEKRPLEILF